MLLFAVFAVIIVIAVIIVGFAVATAWFILPLIIIGGLLALIAKSTANKTYNSSREPEAQAEPAETATPYKNNKTAHIVLLIIGILLTIGYCAGGYKTHCASGLNCLYKISGDNVRVDDQGRLKRITPQ
ncbi:MAG: hypothetical protein AB1465_02320 [Patescibacteria group bacterium]